MVHLKSNPVDLPADEVDLPEASPDDMDMEFEGLLNFLSFIYILLN